MDTIDLVVQFGSRLGDDRRQTMDEQSAGGRRSSVVGRPYQQLICGVLY